MKVTRQTCNSKAQVVADATGLVSHTGSLLLGELAARLGLTDGLIRTARLLAGGGCWPWLRAGSLPMGTNIERYRYNCY
jgi:hypothetical protein